MNDTAFRTRAAQYLQTLLTWLEAEGEKHDFDADIAEGVLLIEPAKGGQYVLNAHAPTQQLWLSSPKSGAHHFVYAAQEAQWVSTKGVELRALLQAELCR